MEELVLLIETLVTAPVPEAVRVETLLPTVRLAVWVSVLVASVRERLRRAVLREPPATSLIAGVSGLEASAEEAVRSISLVAERELLMEID